MSFRLCCICFGALLALVASPTSHAGGCALPARGPVLASLTSVAAPEMYAAGVSEQACLSVEQLIALTPAATPAAPVANSAGYVPKTQFDNTPWRFNMHQNGRNMTAEEFDAWMKAKGIHVASGKPATGTTPAAGACQPSETITC